MLAAPCVNSSSSGDQNPLSRFFVRLVLNTLYVLAWSGGRIESDPKVSGAFREQQPILRTGPLSERTTYEGPAYTT